LETTWQLLKIAFLLPKHGTTLLIIMDNFSKFEGKTGVKLKATLKFEVK